MAEASPTTKQAASFDEQSRRIRSAAANVEHAITLGEQQVARWPEERARLTTDLPIVVQTWVAALQDAQRPVSFAPLHAAILHLVGFKGRMRRHPLVAAFRRYLLGLRVRLFLWRLLIIIATILGLIVALGVLAITISLVFSFLAAIREWLVP